MHHGLGIRPCRTSSIHPSSRGGLTSLYFGVLSGCIPISIFQGDPRFAPTKPRFSRSNTLYKLCISAIFSAFRCLTRS